MGFEIVCPEPCLGRNATETPEERDWSCRDRPDSRNHLRGVPSESPAKRARILCCEIQRGENI